MNSICIVDFNGIKGGFITAFWADYDTTKKIVFFGGEWSDIPPWKVTQEPSQNAIYAHVLQYRKGK